MPTIHKREDRRISRTQQLLREAFMDVIREKGFAATSIQDITERANVNRGTFYIHFADKYELLDTIIREEFRRQWALLPDDCRWNSESLYRLILLMLTTFEDKYHHTSFKSHIFEGVSIVLEQTVHQELAGLLLRWLNQTEGIKMGSFTSLEMVADIVSWTIFGPSLNWSQQPLHISAEQMAQNILLVISQSIVPLHLTQQTE